MLDISIGMSGGVLLVVVSKDASDPPVAIISTLSEDVNIRMRSNSSSTGKVSPTFLIFPVVDDFFDFLLLLFEGSSRRRSV